MAKFGFGLFLLGIAAVSALPTDPIIRRDPGLRYQYAEGPDDKLYLVDTWTKISDLSASARYNPDVDNVYHLFTRSNPTVSQPILYGNVGQVGTTNYDPQKRTAVLIHGWLGSATAASNQVVLPAFLAAEDINVIVVDWSAGADTVDYLAANHNAVPCGESVARFIIWLNGATGSTLAQYHIVGHSLGGHVAGIVGRNINGDIPYITGLDPAMPGWLTNNNRFQADDGIYTEVIHTNAGGAGFLLPLGQVDFYPNGGSLMPGCIDPACDHSRSYYYFVESLGAGTFTGRECDGYATALLGACFGSETLNMGGLVPKTGSTGVYYLQTNAGPPFSKD